MLKTRLLVALCATMTFLSAFTTSAMAEFESTTGKSQGSIKTFPEKTEFQTVVGGPSVECKSKNAEGKVIAEGGWQIQVKSTTQQGKFFYHAPALKGPDEQFKIVKFGICTGPVGTNVETACNLQVSSNGNSSIGTGSAYPPGCKQVIGTSENNCTIITQPDGNKELQDVELANIGTGVEILDAINGITTTVQESKTLCKTLGIKGGQKTGSYKASGALVTEGQKLV